MSCAAPAAIVAAIGTLRETLDGLIAHAGTRVVGLDGVVAQQQNYRKSGFALAYANIRYGGTVAASNAEGGGAEFTVKIPASRTGVFRKA